jgi:anthranilate synthase component 1
VVCSAGEVHVQAGGGTVADASPQYEYEESVNKAKAVMSAIEMATNQPGWW